MNFHDVRVTLCGPPQEYFTRLLAWFQDVPMCRTAKLSGGAPKNHGCRVFVFRSKELGRLQVTSAEVEKPVSITKVEWRVDWRHWPLAKMQEIINPIIDNFYCWHVTIEVHQYFDVGLRALVERPISMQLQEVDVDINANHWCRFPATAALRPESKKEWTVLTPVSYLNNDLLCAWGANDDRFTAAQRVVPDMRVLRMKNGRWIVCPCEGLGLSAINDRLRLLYGALRSIAVQPMATTSNDNKWSLPSGTGIGAPAESKSFE